MKWFRAILLVIILVGGAVLCAVRWHAWFANPVEPEFEGDTISYHFFTFGQDSVPGFVPTSNGWRDTIGPDTLQFILLGDVHNAVDSIQWALMAERHPKLDFYAQLGDFMERSYFYYAQQLYHQLNGTAFAQLPVITCPGNHEYMKGVVRRLPDTWYQIFAHPLNGPQRFLGSTYYVDFPSLRLVVIDTNGLQTISDFTIVHTWAMKALMSSGNRFRIVMMHHPVYSSAHGRQNILIYLAFRSLASKSDLIFSGHDHNYVRQLPFVGTNSTRKYHRPKNSAAPSYATKQLYELITITSDSLWMETRLIDSGELCDSVVLAH